jgi:hypothetical protein
MKNSCIKIIYEIQNYNSKIDAYESYKFLGDSNNITESDAKKIFNEYLVNRNNDKNLRLVRKTVVTINEIINKGE